MSANNGNQKRALISGITGQDGSYLAEFLLEKQYEVHGIIRRSSSFNTQRIDHIYPQLYLHYGDLLDSSRLMELIQLIKPDEVYNLAAQSHVKVSFDEPVYSCDVIALGTLRLLDAIKVYQNHKGKQVKFYQASSSELFGNQQPKQNENTPFKPCSPYACGKLFAHEITHTYRDSYNIFACCGILFNHESPRRGETFVTRKITKAIGRIKKGLQDKLYLGNLDTYRDWGYAKEYVEAMWLMLQQNKPDDFVIATGEAHSVREFVELAFSIAELDWKECVKIDERYYRPNEVYGLCGNASKAKDVLGWETKMSFGQLVQMMVECDMLAADYELTLANK